jgi:subtilisin family serine protease
MRRIAHWRTRRPCLTKVAVLFSILLSLPLSVLAQSRANIRVTDSSQLQAVPARYGLSVRKTIDRGNGGLLVVDGDARLLKERTKGDPYIAWVEDDKIIPLDDNGETVLPLDDNGETVLPLGSIVEPLDDNGETVLPLDDNGETVLPLDDNGETVLPLDAINRVKSYFNWAGQVLTPSQTLLIQWPFVKIGLYDAQMRSTGSGVIVADLNTGVDTCHPVLRGTLQISFVNEATIPENCPTADTPRVPGFGHGTAVGGIIKLIAPQATLWSLRVFDSSGVAQAADVYEAIVYAADHGAKVINMSFGTLGQSQTIAEAVNYAYQRGVTMISAAGNDGVDGLMYPAANSQVRSVVAVSVGGVKASFSNYARNAFVSAPGVKVWVPYPERKMSLASGTSYAAPMVAAEAALLLSGFARNHSTPPTRNMMDMVLSYTGDNVDALNAPQFWLKLGRGRINIPKAEDLMGISKLPAVGN